MSSHAKSSPKDAQVMSAILKDMGVLESEPRLINQMLEFTYRYVTDILEDAKVFSSHANRKGVDGDDIRLAVQMKVDHSFTTPPPRDLLMEVARQKNSQPLPLVKPYCGPRLPPDRYCLTAPSYKLKSVKKSRGAVPYSLPVSQRFAMGAQVKSLGGSTLAVVTKSLTQPTVTILNKTQATPKPTVRMNPGIAGAIGASGLTRIVSTGGISGSSTGLTTVAAPATAAVTTVAPPAAAAASTPAISVTINPLKRKLEDDDDYDNM